MRDLYEKIGVTDFLKIAWNVKDLNEISTTNIFGITHLILGQTTNEEPYKWKAMMANQTSEINVKICDLN